MKVYNWRRTKIFSQTIFKFTLSIARLKIYNNLRRIEEKIGNSGIKIFSFFFKWQRRCKISVKIIQSILILPKTTSFYFLKSAISLYPSAKIKLHTLLSVCHPSNMPVSVLSYLATARLLHKRYYWQSSEIQITDQTVML